MILSELKMYNWKNVDTDQDSRGEENLQKTTKTVSFLKQDNKVIQDHHKDIKTSSKHSRKSIHHIILPHLTTLMASSMI